METKKATQGSRSTDRVLEALSTLAAFLDRTINEVKSLDLEFQNRVLQAVHDTETSLQSQAAQHLETALNETRTKLEEQFKTRLSELSAEWHTERERLNAEVDRAAKKAVDWEAERSRLNTEIDRLTQAHAAAVEEAAKVAAATPPPATAAKISELLPEIERVERLIKNISKLIDDPSTELSTVIRKNVERSELEAYLRGIRYAAEPR
jgi:DNA repair exonuclease SbcCD ATPase subunit